MVWQAVIAGTVELEGSAIISHGAVSKARIFAIKDAMRQAVLQSAAQVTTISVLSAHTLSLDSTKVRAVGQARNVRVLDEWVEEGVFHVLVRMDILDSKMAPIPVSPNPYRKKVAVTQFHVMDRGRIHDLPGVEIELPRLLLRHLERRGGVIGVDATPYLLGSTANDSAGGGTGRGVVAVSKLADSLGVQFLVSGVIRNMAVSNGIFGGIRHLNLEIRVFDGITGVLIGRHRYREQAIVNGDKRPGLSFTDKVNSGSDFGALIESIIARQVVAIQADLGHLPFSARVIRSEGDRIYFDAGASSLVRVGDVLMAYKIDGEPLVKSNGSSFGYPETPLATLVVKMVQPLFAVGELETDQVMLNPGDIVRFIR